MHAVDYEGGHSHCSSRSRTCLFIVNGFPPFAFWIVSRNIAQAYKVSESWRLPNIFMLYEYY